MSKRLVAYFSASGVTKAAAERLAAAAGADIFEIKPVQPYTAADLNWMDKQSRSTLEMKDPAARPAIAGVPEDMSGYDVVFIGFPIWWYVAPAIIRTFVERCDLSGKTVALFATSGGSGFGKTTEGLRALCPDSVKWAGEKLIRGGVSDGELSAWADSVEK